MKARHSSLFHAMALTLFCATSAAMAQHAGDIRLEIQDDALFVSGPIGGEDTNGVFYGEFGDTGFPGYTSNPGFDAQPGALPPGRIGFQVLAGLRRWDPDLEIWLDPADVGERLDISFITLSTMVEDEPIAGFDLAVQPDGGWHRHVNFELMNNAKGTRTAGVYRLDLSLYSTMGIADSNSFTIAFGYEATEDEINGALVSLTVGEPDCSADLDGNDVVDGADFGLLLAAFGSDDAAADLDGDGIVTGSDIGLLLSLWGQCS